MSRFSDLAGTTKVGETAQAYDSSMRVTNITHKDGSGTTLTALTYGYDTANRLTSQQIDGTTTNFGYDSVNQLTSDGSSYSYDLNGNRTMAGYTTGSGNRLTNDGVWTYTYDAEGNLTKKSKGATAETWNYTHDHRNRMTKAERSQTDGGAVDLRLEYDHDVFARRIEERRWTSTVATVTTRFGYDGQDVWADLDGSNALVTRYVRPDGIDALVARVSAAGTIAYYLTDRQGSVVALTDNSGVVQDRITYNGTGKIASETAPAFGDRYKYAAREWQPDLGMYDVRARFYKPDIGRFVGIDPIGFQAGDANLFRYVGNSYPNYTDPSGLVAEWALEWLGFEAVMDLSRAGDEQAAIDARIAAYRESKGQAPLAESRSAWSVGWEAAWEGYNDARKIQRNVYTFGLVPSWNEESERLIAENGELYAWSEVAFVVSREALIVAVTGGFGGGAPAAQGTNAATKASWFSRAAGWVGSTQLGRWAAPHAVKAARLAQPALFAFQTWNVADGAIDSYRAFRTGDYPGTVKGLARTGFGSVGWGSALKGTWQHLRALRSGGARGWVAYIQSGSIAPRRGGRLPHKQTLRPMRRILPPGTLMPLSGSFSSACETWVSRTTSSVTCPWAAVSAVPFTPRPGRAAVSRLEEGSTSIAGFSTRTCSVIRQQVGLLERGREQDSGTALTQ